MDAVREPAARPAALDVVLETVGLRRSFGSLQAVADVSLRIGAGEFVGIVGPNGAGKTTFVNLITGYLKPGAGRIIYRGRDVTGLPPEAITRLGIARSFQVPQLYPSLTLLENVLIALGAGHSRGLSFWRPLRQPELVSAAGGILEQFGLGDERDRPASQLSEGGRKLLDIALAFALRPSLLLMDEPTSGVSKDEKFAVMDVLVGVLKQASVTTVFIEHDMEVVQRYAERVLVFFEGRVVADGPPSTVLGDPHVRRVVVGVLP